MTSVSWPGEGQPQALSGTVLVALTNDPALIAGLGEAVNAAPYKAAPKAPVLGVKPRNTWAADGARIGVPAEGVTVGASVAIVIGRTASAVSAEQALDHVAGYTLAVDLALPLASHYRPAIRQRARDGFCPIGSHLLPASACAQPEQLALPVWIDGAKAHDGTPPAYTRNVARLVADVSDFMTLQPGDLLLLGPAAGAPVAKAGQQVTIEAGVLGRLAFTLVDEADAPPPGAMLVPRLARAGAALGAQA